MNQPTTNHQNPHGYIHNDSQLAFEEAIAAGLLSDVAGASNYAGDHMYMYTLNGCDYFKNIDSRRYVSITDAEKVLRS